MDDLKEWLEDRIKKYESAFEAQDISPDIMFEYAGLRPGTTYELGRYDALIEIRGLLKRHGIND
jgi:hypothetical protein